MLIELFLTQPVLFLTIVLILIISISLHELAHGWAALNQGDDTPKIKGHMTINPVVHMGWSSIILLCLAGIAWGQMPVNPANFRSHKWGNVIVSAAGPLLNLSLALLGIIFMSLFRQIHLSEMLSMQFFYLLAKINIVLCIFNLMPIPPLDGFHVFSEFVPGLKSLGTSQLGLFAFMILFMSGFFGSLFNLADIIIEALVNF